MTVQRGILRIGVTGASGYVGRAVVAAAGRAGLSVVAIGRRAAPKGIEWRHSDLTRRPDDDLLAGLDAVVHLAADTAQRLPAGGDPERAYAEALARQAAERGIPLVFASSQAASAEAPSAYGRNKHAIERVIAEFGAISIRPGLVVGGDESGLFGLLCAFVRRSPLLPKLLPAPAVQPVHVDDLARALLRACELPQLRGRTLAVAGPPMPFDALLGAIATQRLRTCRVFVPAPVPLLRLLLRGLRPILGEGFSSDRFDSLLRLPPLHAEADLRTLDLSLRSPSDALDRRGRPTRRWLREAQALSRAMLRRPAPFGLLRRYPRMLRACGVDGPLELPPGLLALPLCLAALDAPSRRPAAGVGTLAWRMGMVLRLAEAEPDLAADFLGPRARGGRWRVLGGLSSAILSELAARCLAPLARYWWRRHA